MHISEKWILSAVLPFLFIFFSYSLSDSGECHASTCNSDVISVDNLHRVSWYSIGPGNIGGRVDSIAIDPVDERTVYIGAAGGGVWKSSDAGGSWVPITDNLPSLSMGAVAINPENPQVIYVGTGEYNFIHQYGCKPDRNDQYPGQGVFKSTDGGITWNQAGEKFSDSISEIIINPVSTQTVYVVSIDGIFTSIDGGDNWDLILQGMTTSLVIDETSPLVLYAAKGRPDGSSENGIYKTVDGGVTWKKMTKGLPDGNRMSRISLAISVSDPQVLYASVASDSDVKGVYRSEDGGMTWVITSSGPHSDCYKNTIAVDPSDPDTVYVGGFMVYKSTDGGRTWVKIDKTISTYVDYHAMAISRKEPETIYTGNDRGVYKSTDGGRTWESLNHGLSITQFYDIAVNPLTTLVIYGGCQDNGVLKYTGTDDWRDVDYFNDGGFCAVDYENPDTVYFENQYAKIKKSLDAGRTSFSVSEGIDRSRTGFVAPFIIDPGLHDRLYLGTYLLHRTDDGGMTWSAVSPDLTRNLGEHESFITAISVSAADTDVIYVGTSDGNLMVTDDAGDNWYRRISGLPDVFVTDIAVSDYSSGTAWVTFSGYGTQHIFRTDDEGITWESIDSNLPDIPVNSILIGNGEPDIIFAGTDSGIFKTINGGRRWFSYNEGLPPAVVVSDLEMNPGTALIRAATMGRSVFEIDETGDLNGDGRISRMDVWLLFKIVSGIMKSPPDGMFIRADLNGDGAVDIDDLSKILEIVLR